MKIKNLVIAVIIFGLLCGSALAQEHKPPMKAPRITKQQLDQKERIKQGVKSGELTKGETRKLEKQQAKIKHDKKVAKADGKVTPKERAKIRREQNKASKDIKKLKTNEEKQK